MKSSANDAVAPFRQAWRHLGSLAFLFFVVCIASGVYLYVFFDTSLSGAYESGRALTSGAIFSGRLARGLHRYSADAFLIATALHLVREALRGNEHPVARGREVRGRSRGALAQRRDGGE